MRKEPTALPEPQMWIGSGPNPLCQFFLLSSSLNVVLLYNIYPASAFFLMPFYVLRKNFLLLLSLFSANNIFQVKALSPST